MTTAAFRQDTETEDSPLDDLPPEVVEQLEDLEPQLVKDLREGNIDQIPDEVVERLPADVADKIPDSLTDAAVANPGLTVVLVLIGLAALGGAVWGAIKGFLKVAIGLGIIAAIAWFWFFVR